MHQDSGSPSLAIAGAGPSLGLSLARRFGAKGYRIGLIARRAEALSAVVSTLQAEGFEVHSAVADLSNVGQVQTAFAALRAALGDIDVLVFSPISGMEYLGRRPSSVTPDEVRAVFETQTLGAVASVQQVLPAMLARNAGTIILTTGASALYPYAPLTANGIAQSGTRNYAACLHEELKETGVGVGHVSIGVPIGDGDPDHDPAVIADVYVQFAEAHEPHEIPYT